MSIIFALALILTVSAVYLFVIEAFSVAFKLTGMATQKIKFQVASLFTGTGFTTTESELIVNDARRRKIAVVCMYTSHIFSVLIMGLLVNFVMSLFSSINNKTTITAETFTSWYAIVFYVSAVLFMTVLILKIPPINRRFQNFLERVAIKMSKYNRNKNIISVIDMYGKNAVAEVLLNKVPEYARDTTLFEMQLNKKYLINILSIMRGKRTIEVSKDTMFAQGDVVIVFGLTKDIEKAFVKDSETEQDTIVVNKINSLALLNNYGANALMEIEVEEVPQEIDGLPMKDSHLVDRYNINVVIIKRGDEYIAADKDTIIQKGDKITAFGPYKSIKHLFTNE